VTARTLVWTLGALADLEEIADYIALDKPAAALRWAKVLTEMAEQAAAMPDGVCPNSIAMRYARSSSADTGSFTKWATRRSRFSG
jgi:plasmid stabilization system protein ParE